MEHWIDTVLRAPRTRSAPPAHDLDGEEALRLLGVELPAAHLQLLTKADGLRLFDGYFELFPLRGTGRSIRSWNDPAAWKFAWPSGLDEYLCFGETIWGDQYAYQIQSLSTDKEAEVFFLDALRMSARKLSDDFEGFGAKYLARNAVQPFDSVLRDAHARFGQMPPDTHLVFGPSVLMTGEERLEHVVPMPARQAMILNGDLWTQLSNPPESSTVAQLQVVKDSEGRDRTRVVWAQMAEGDPVERERSGAAGDNEKA